MERAVNHCDNCGVDVDAALRECPLCHAPLTETPEQNGLYGPVRPDPPPAPSFYQDLLVFLSIFFVAGALAVNLLEWRGTPWFLALAAVIACIWLEMRIFTSKWLFGTKLFLQLIALCILTFCFDYIAGWSGWSLGIALPLGLLAANVATDLYAYWYKSRWKPSLLYGLLFAALGFIPLVLCLTGLVRVFWPSVLCAVSSVISLLGMVRFALRSLRSELKKRLHI